MLTLIGKRGWDDVAAGLELKDPTQLLHALLGHRALSRAAVGYLVAQSIGNYVPEKTAHK